MTFSKRVDSSSVTASRSRAVAAFLLSFALLVSVVAMGWWSVRAEENAWSCEDLTVKEAPAGGWYVYEKDPTTDTQALKAEQGEVACTTYTGIASNEYGWWRVENGKVNFKATGLYANELGYWYVKNGKVNFNYTGFLQGNYYVHRQNGSPVYSDEKGTEKNKPMDTKGTNAQTASTNKAFWYLKKGRLQTAYTGAKKGTINGTEAWWRVEGGRANLSYKGVAKNEYGWWYFKDGKVDFTYTGVARNNNGWWRIEDGKVNFKYNGVASNEYGSWYLVNGKVDFDYSGAFTLDGYMYVVEKGRVISSEKLTVTTLNVVRPTVKFTYYGAELSWSAVKCPDGKQPDGYEIYVKNGPAKSWSKIGTVDGKTLSFRHTLNSNADPGQNTRLYDVRAVRKNGYGIVVSRSAENKQTAQNNFVGGAFGIAAPDIVNVDLNPVKCSVTFKTVPYATSYEVYYGLLGSDGKVSKWSKATTAKAESSGSGSPSAASSGWTAHNQTVNFSYKAGYDILTVKAVYTEQAGNGYSALTLNSTYDTGFRLNQNQLKGQNILFLGDSLIAGTPYGPSKPDYTIPTRVAAQTGANVYNAAVGGAVLVSDYPRIVNNSIYHNQNLLISDGSYSKITDETWKGISDLSDFDIVVLEGGPNDYYQRVPLGTPDSTKVSTFYGALNKHMALFKEASQKRLAEGKSRIKVVLVENFYINEMQTANRIGLTETDYNNAIRTIADLYDEDPDVDVYLYTGHNTVLNAKNFMYETVDSVHMTAYRYGQMGNHLSLFLKSLKAKEHAAPAEPTSSAAAAQTAPKTAQQAEPKVAANDQPTTAAQAAPKAETAAPAEPKTEQIAEPVLSP